MNTLFESQAIYHENFYVAFVNVQVTSIDEKQVF